MEALEFIETLSPQEKQEALDEIENQVNEYYYRPLPGGYSAADLDKMF